MQVSPGKWWGLRRMSGPNGRFAMLAVDQRPPLKNLVKDKRGSEDAGYDDVCALKRTLVEHLAPYATAVLLDPHYAYPAAVDLLDPRHGLIVTLEDSLFAEAPGGRRSSTIDGWSVDQIKRLGADAVKVLAWYHPEADATVRQHQQDFVKRVGEHCARYDITFLLELLLYPLDQNVKGQSNYVEDPDKYPERIIESVETFAHPDFAVDLYKLESPLPAKSLIITDDKDGEDYRRQQAWFDALDKAVPRPWVMLSAGASMEAFEQILRHAYQAGASGYLAGRALWWQAAQRFPDLAAVAHSLRHDAAHYAQRINRLTDNAAKPWAQHLAACNGVTMAPSGEGFRHDYAPMLKEVD